MTNVLIRRNAPNDSCRNLTALMSHCTKTSFIITPHYICAHRNPDNVHNAAFLRYSAGNGGRAHFGGLTSTGIFAVTPERQRCFGFVGLAEL